MATERLKRHYDEKYAQPRDIGGGSAIPLVAHPDDRFEACVKTVSERFHGGAVLEIGGGDGRIALSLLRAGLPCERYVLSDLSEVRIRQAAATIDDPRVEARVLDIEREPVHGPGEPGYDCVIMVALIEHLIDPISAMTTIAASLKPDGFAYIMTPNVAKWTKRIHLMRGRFPSTGSRQEGLVTYEGSPVDLHDEGHLHYFTFRSLSRLLLERSGFERVERLPYASRPAPLGPRIGHALARLRPELFSELCVVAYAGASDSRRERASV